MQCDVLAYEHAYSDAGQVEAVEKLVDVGQVIQVYRLAQLPLQLCGGLNQRAVMGHDREK